MRYEAVREVQDRGVAWLLRSKERVLELLALRAPALLEVLDPDSLAPVPASLVSSALARVDEDVIWEGRLASGERLFLLVAHQSTHDPLIGFRVGRGSSFLDAQAQRGEEEAGVPRGAQRLAAVVPLLVHTGARPWRPPRLAALQPDAPALRRFRRDQEVLLLDLPSASEEELLAVGGVLGAVLLLFSARRRPLPSLEDALERVLRRLRALVPDREPFLGLVFFCLQLVKHGRTREETVMLNPVFDRHATRREVDVMIQTAAEADRAEGRAEGQQIALMTLVQARFGPASAELVEAIGALTSAAEFARLIPLAVEVTSLEAFRRELQRGR